MILLATSAGTEAPVFFGNQLGRIPKRIICPDCLFLSKLPKIPSTILASKPVLKLKHLFGVWQDKNVRILINVVNVYKDKVYKH